MMAAGYDGSIRIDTRIDETGFNKGVKNMSSGIDNLKSSLNKLAAAVGVAFSIGALLRFKKETEELYAIQLKNEVKLETVMRKRMGATQEQIQAIKDLASAEQALGIIGDEVQLAGAQQLATFLNQTESLKVLIPAMDHLVAQQYDYNATEEGARNVANMMGKVFTGQVGALTRVGISFSEAEEKILKYGTEAEKAATLAQVIENNVGKMNYALAQTDIGRQKQLSNTMGDIKEQFGAAFTQISVLLLPALNTVANVLAKIAALARQVAQAIANIFGKNTKQQVKQQEQIASTAGTAAKAETGLAEATEKAGKAAKGSLAGFDELNVLQKDTGSGEGGSGAGGGGADIFGDTEEIEVPTAIENALNRLKNLLEPLKQINLDNLSASFDKLKAAAAPITKGLFEGLEWAWQNIFIPLAQWTIEDVLPVFLDILAAGLEILGSIIEAVKPLFLWLWDNFLQPIAAWTGGLIVDILRLIAEGLTAVSDWMVEHKTLVETFVVIIGSVAAAFLLVSGAITAVTTVMKLWKTATNLAMIATGALSVATELSISPFLLVVAAVAAVIAIVVLLVTHWDEVKEVAAKVWNKIKEIWGVVADWLNKNVVEPVKKFFTDLWDSIGKLAETCWNFIKGVWDKVSGWFNDYIIKPISEFFSKLWEVVSEAAKTAWEKISKLSETCWNAIKEVWDVVTGWFKEKIIDPVVNFFTELWQVTAAEAKKGWEGISKFASDGWTAIQNTWKAVKNWFTTNVTEPLNKLFSNLWNGVKDTAKKCWDGVLSLFSKGGEIFSGIKDGIVSAFKAIVNALISGINTIISTPFHKVNSLLNDIRSTSIMGVRPFSGLWRMNPLPVPQIPKLATGAVIPPNAEFMAILGDQKNGRNLEAPEGLIRQIIQEEVGAMDVKINFNGNLSQLARVLKPHIDIETRRRGVSLIAGDPR